MTCLAFIPRILIKAPPISKADLLRGTSHKGWRVTYTEEAVDAISGMMPFISIGDKKVVTVLYWGSKEAEKAHEEDLEKILKSVKSLVEAKEGEAEEEE